MASSPSAARSVGQPSPAPSHATAATFGNAGGSSAPAGGLRPPPSGAQSMQRSPSQNTAYSSRSKHSPAAGRPNGAALASEPPYVIDGPGGRIACVADVRGNISMFNQIADETDAQAIIHTGDFGFYERSSFERISDRTLRHLVQYSTLVPPNVRSKLLGSDPPRGPASAERANASTGLRSQVLAHQEPLLSEFPHLLDGTIKLKVPVFTVWGACEDVVILERFRTGEYQVPNLYVLDEATTKAIEVGGVRLRLFGLGGAVVLHKLFDNGEGAATIAGGQGTMWTTALQIGELVDTAQKVYDPTETRVLITHASPGREGLLAQLALALKADLTISAGLHFRYGVSYNEFSVQHDAENYRNKLQHSKQAFSEIWETVKSQVDAVIDDNQRVLLHNALGVANRVPPTATATGAASEEPAWKNTWNWNLPDAAYGNLVLSVRDGRVSAETKSQGFNFAYRRNSTSMSAATPVAPASTATPAKPAASTTSPKAATPSEKQSGAAATNGTPTPAAATPGTKSPGAASAKSTREKKTPRERGHESSASRSDGEGLTSGTEGGRKSPSSGREKRNPYTLYVSQLKEALPVSEKDLRDYFGPAAAGITAVKLIFDKERTNHRRGASSGKEDASASAPGPEGGRRQRPFAYVEFKDEEAMAAGLKRQGETIKGTEVKPALEQADSAKALLAGAPAAKPERKERRQRRDDGAATDKEEESKTADESATPKDGPGGKGRKARGGKGNKKTGGSKNENADAASKTAEASKDDAPAAAAVAAAGDN